MAYTGLKERLQNGGTIVMAEGYIFEFERRGYLQAGAFVPEVVLKHPDLVKSMHEEFVHAGSDVVVALTYYGNREKLRLVGLEQDLETHNKKALRIAKGVAMATGTLCAGNLCNSTIYRRDDNETIKKVQTMFKEQVEWAADEGADFVLGETFGELGEAMLALEAIQKYGKGMPAIINLAATGKDVLHDGIKYGDACRKLEEAGAAVVGFNCSRGPATMASVMKEVRAACKGPIACVPVMYRTTLKQPTFQSLVDSITGKPAFPIDLPAHACNRSEVAEFATSMKELGVQVIGLCCGNASHYTRIVAEVYGRKPPGSAYSPDMSQHFMYGDKKKFHTYHTEGMVSMLLGDNSLTHNQTDDVIAH